MVLVQKTDSFYSCLREAQLKMISMLELIDSICQKYQIDYWLDAGTLLGAIRHHAFIPWNDDMGIGMPRASYERFLEVAPKELPQHIMLQTCQSDSGYFNMAVPLKIREQGSHYVEQYDQENEPYMQGIFIDVFVYDCVEENPTTRRLYKFLAQKISRFLCAKYSIISIGHYANAYKWTGQLIPTPTLESSLQQILSKAKRSSNPYLRRGYQCVGSSFLHYSDIYPLKRSLFENKYFNIPNNADELLRQQFGDYHTLPAKNKRVIRHYKVLLPETTGKKKQ